MGSACLRLLAFAVLYLFGLEYGVRTRKLSQFFKLIRIHHHVGVSEAALRTRIQQMKLLLPQFQEACGQTAGQQTIKEQSLTVRKDYDQTRQVQTTYQENLQGISDAVHPFSLSDNSPNDAEKVEGVLETRAKAIERLAIYLTTIN